MENMSGSSFGAPTGGFSVPAPKGKRFASALVDLLLIPVVLGIIVGFLLLNLPEGPRSIILVLVNIGWMIFRDMVFSPGRAMVSLKLISLTGGKVTFQQALLRNILLIIPFVLIVGFIVEIIAIISKSERVADGWAKTRVISL